MSTETLTSFVPISGDWDFDGSQVEYKGPSDATIPHGVCLARSRFRSGMIETKVTVQSRDSSARIIVGFNAATQSYYSIGLGGYGSAYLLDTHVAGEGWRQLDRVGSASQIPLNSEQHLRVELLGQKISLLINDVLVIQSTIPNPLEGSQVGLFAWGSDRVLFREFSYQPNVPRVFVIMQFGGSYDSLYKDVIAPTSESSGFEAFRADDIFRPGIILEDIRRGIIESDVIVAEIIPTNPNVFYELGYAHALNKPTTF